jgi:predicted TIM-barrel fold metal-dependent hydrolase
MLIDANGRLGPFPWGEVNGVGAPEFVARMDSLGIARAVVSHTMSWRHDPAKGNARIVDELAGHDRLSPCWVALPGSCGELPAPRRFVEQARAAGVVATRVYPEDHGFDLAGPDFAGYADAFEDARLPVMVDIAQTSWAAVETVASAHPELPLIVGEIGYRLLREAAGVLGRNENVFVDLSGFTTHEGLEWLCARFGPRRVVFGTGAPLRDPGEALTRLLWSGLDDEAVADIGHRTIERLVAP